MPSSRISPGRRIRAIIFDMDNTLFDFVAAKQHACREVAKELGRDDWEALFSCFINSPHGFESHENIRDYFDLCGLLEECSRRKNTGEVDEKEGDILNVPVPPVKNIPADTPSPERENVVRISISQVTRSPGVISPSETSLSQKAAANRRVSVPSACAIPPQKGSPEGGQPEPQAGSSTPDKGESPTLQPPLKPVPNNLVADRISGEVPSPRPSPKPVRDNLLADKSLYCNEVFSRCCAIYEAEKVRVLEPYPGAREILAELKRRGFPLAVLTDAHNGNALARLRKTDLFDFFDFIISYDMTGAKKPAPDAFLLALEKLGTKPSETLLVGDSIRRDIAPAKELGMITAYAKYGDRNVPPTTPITCKPDYMLTTIEELVGLVEKIEYLRNYSPS